VAKAAPAESCVLRARVRTGLVLLGCAVEMDIAQCHPKSKGLRASLGLAEPAAGRFIRAAYALIDLISLVDRQAKTSAGLAHSRRNTAQKAAGKIHSTSSTRLSSAPRSLRWDDLCKLAVKAKCREAAKLRLEGKEYVVADGERDQFPFQRVRELFAAGPELSQHDPHGSQANASRFLVFAPYSFCGCSSGINPPLRSPALASMFRADGQHERGKGFEPSADPARQRGGCSSPGGIDSSYAALAAQAIRSNCRGHSPHRSMDRARVVSHGRPCCRRNVAHRRRDLTAVRNSLEREHGPVPASAYWTEAHAAAPTR